MENYQFYIIIGLLVIFIIYILYHLAIKTNERDDAIENRQRWERGYWILRGSDAIRDDYIVYLSWSKRGEEECIIKRIPPR